MEATAPFTALLKLSSSLQGRRHGQPDGGNHAAAVEVRTTSGAGLYQLYPIYTNWAGIHARLHLCINVFHVKMKFNQVPLAYNGRQLGWEREGGEAKLGLPLPPSGRHLGQTRSHALGYLPLKSVVS